LQNKKIFFLGDIMMKILFICMGNICRSPTAEAVMQSIVKQKGKEKEIFCDSAGTIDYHRGQPADSRMREHSILRGYELKSISRPFEDADFKIFDLIITMDEDNFQQINFRDEKNEYSSKILRMVEFCSSKNIKEIPDPYYGGSQGFENVLDLLEDSCCGLFKYITDQKK